MVKGHTRIIILFLLVLGLFFTTHSVNASPSYLPGVKPGDWAYYGTIGVIFQSNDPLAQPPDLLTAKSVNNTIQNIQGSIVNVQQNVSLTSQTYPRVRTLTGNLSSGQGTLDGWLIAGGLVKGDGLAQYTAPVPNPFPNPVINVTAPEVYAGAVRTVNIVNSTLTLPPAGITSYYHVSVNTTIVYDQRTGVLLELSQKSYDSYNFPGGTSSYTKEDLHILITNTSLWKGSTTPGFVVISNTTDIIIGQNTNAVVQLTVFSLNHFQGTVTFPIHVTSQGPSATIAPASVFLPADGSVSALLTFAGHDTPIGRYDFNVTGTANQLAANSILGHVTVQLPDFSFQSPTSVTVLTSGGFVGDAFLKSIAGFSSTVTFSSSSTPSGLRAVLVQPSVMVTPAGTSQVALSIEPAIGATSPAPGNYVLSVSAISGAITHTNQISVSVLTEFPSFNITADPASLDIPQGGTAISIIAIHALDAYDPSMSFASLDVKVAPQGPNVSIFPSFIILLTPIGTSTLTVTIPESTPIGTYEISVNATYNGHHHNATVTVNVKSQSVTSPDFVLNLDPVSRTITAGSSTTILVKAHGRNGFSDTLHFTAGPTSQNGPSSRFDTSSVSLSSSYPDGTVTLTVNAPASLSPGTYKIEIVGTSSTGSHTVEATVNVQSSTGTQGTATNPSIFGLSMPIFYGIIGGIIAVAAAIGLLVYSRTKSRVIVP